MGIGTGWINAVRGAGEARIGYNDGLAKRQESDAKRQMREAEVRQRMVKDALEIAARKQTQGNADRNYELSKERLDIERNRKPVHEQISERVRELVSQKVPLLEASRQARLEFGQRNPTEYGSDEYISRAVAVTKARAAARPPRTSRGSSSDPNSPAKASQRERHLNGIADRAILAAGGDVNKAGEILLQQPETANIFTQGLNASHLNAAASRYRLRAGARSRSEAPTVPAPKKARLTDLVAPPPSKVQGSTSSEQQRDWDEAAAALRKQGNQTPASVLGPRPASLSDPVARYLTKYRTPQQDDDPVEKYLAKYPKGNEPKPKRRVDEWRAEERKEWGEKYGGKKLNAEGVSEDEVRRQANRKNLTRAGSYVADEVRRGGAIILDSAKEAVKHPGQFASSLVHGGH